MYTAQRWTFLLAIVFAGVNSADTKAGEVCCKLCGCSAPCQKVCRLVCEEKKVEVVCWGCQCEDFCVPGRSRHGCRHCESVCDTCKDDTVSKVCSLPKKFVWTEWFPGGAHTYTKKKLMKKTVTVKVPSHKWVTEDLCSDCTINCGGVIMPPSEESKTSTAGLFTPPPLAPTLR